MAPSRLCGRRIRWRCGWFMLFLTVVIIVHKMLSHCGLFEFFRQAPLIDFVYPLDVDLEELDSKIERGHQVNVTPLNDFDWLTVPGSSNRCVPRNASKEVIILILVKSHTRNWRRRRLIRETWGHEFDHKLNRIARQKTAKIRTLFLVAARSEIPEGNGHPEDSIDPQLVKEQNKYRDLLIGDFVEQYPNQTLKTIFGFKWVATKCKQAQYIVFSDDECLVHTTNVVTYIENIMISVDRAYMRLFILGYVWRYESPVRSKSDPKYVSVSDYAYYRYPPYADDRFYIIPVETLQRLYRVMPYVKLATPIEVYIGIIAYKLQFKISTTDDIYVDKVEYDKNRFRFLLASVGFLSDEELNRFWTYITAM